MSEPRDTAAPRREDVPERWFHLGVDYGTCWSKLVLRDYEAPTNRAYVLSPEDGLGGALRACVPSLVAIDGDRFVFGHEAARRTSRDGVRVIESVKMRTFYPEDWPTTEPLPEGFGPAELSALVVAYLLGIGTRQADRIGGGSFRPRLTMTMGVPTRVVGTEDIQRHAVEVARLAHEACRLEPGLEGEMPIARARALLAAARDRLASRPPASNPRDWVRAESEAGLLWFFNSPAVRAGLYGCVDIGAGTTDVSFFRIWEEFQTELGHFHPTGISFLGDASRPAGMDMVGRILRPLHGGSVHDGRGRETELFERAPHVQRMEVKAQSERAFEVFKTGFHRGYSREPGQGAWSRARLFLMGGGARFEPFRTAVQAPPCPPQIPAFSVLDPGVPEDLTDLDGAGIGYDRHPLLVAYGLSFTGQDVPPAEQATPFEPRQVYAPRKPREQDDLYPP